MDQIQKEIDSFYAKYAKDEGITIAQARSGDMEEYSRKVKKYVKEKELLQTSQRRNEAVQSHYEGQPIRGF